MLDLFNFPTAPQNADIQVFCETQIPEVSIHPWKTWNKPRGVSMCYMLAIGCGGNGGSGAVGAASTAAGGGGGGSGGQSSLLIPAMFLPDVLYVHTPMSGSVFSSVVAVDATLVGVSNQTHVLLRARGGGNGGNASGATAGIAGTAGAASVTSINPLAGLGKYNFIAGQAGTAGGTTGTGGQITALPLTGLCVTGGTGGGGLPALGSACSLPGSIVGSGKFPSSWINGNEPSSGGIDAPGVPGGRGMKPLPDVLFFYGGCGGSSQSLSATGAPAGGGNGADGAIGCGGGGGGGGFTGSTPSVGGLGGPGLVVIISW